MLTVYSFFVSSNAWGIGSNAKALVLSHRSVAPTGDDLHTVQQDGKMAGGALARLLKIGRGL